jgi:general secretion pathway protein M
MKLALPTWWAPAREWWRRLAARERRLVGGVAAAAVLLALWGLALAPAWRTLRSAPVELEAIELQLQQMRRLAGEVRELRAAPSLQPAQAGVALKAATDRLGDKAKLSLQGDRAVLTLQGVSGEQLRAWLSEARSGARARTTEAQLTRNAAGLSGTLIVALGPAR